MTAVRLESYSFLRSLHRVVASPALGRGVPSSELQVLQPCFMNCQEILLTSAEPRREETRRPLPGPGPGRCGASQASSRESLAWSEWILAAFSLVR